MEDPRSASIRKIERTRQRRVRTEKTETVLIVALAGLVLFKGGPIIIGLALGIGEMMIALTRL